MESQRGELLDSRAWEMGGVGIVTPLTLPVVPLLLQQQQPAWLSTAVSQPSWDTLNGV